jgi:hypothetical protein
MTATHNWRAAGGLAWGEYVFADGSLIADLRGVVRRGDLQAFVDGMKDGLSGKEVEGVLLDFSMCGLAILTSQMLETLRPFHDVPLAVTGSDSQAGILKSYESIARIAGVRHKHATDADSAAEWLGIMALNRSTIIL